MSRSTTTLIALFGALILYGVISAVVYPEWIQPLLTIDQRIAKRQKEYDALKALGERVDRASKEYVTMLSRVGSFDVGKIETAVRARLNELIESHQLESANVSPSRPKTDRKTGLTTLQITVTAMGKLRSVTEFLKAMAELPQLARVGNVAIYPARRSRKSQERDRMNMRMPIEILVLPQQKVVGKFKEDERNQLERFVRHEDRDYSLIWENKPFTERIPLRVNAGRDVKVKQGRQARLSAKPIGGEAPYTFSWDPPEGLSNPDIANPTIDTSNPFSSVVTLTVVDVNGDTATDTVMVAVQESTRKLRDIPKPPDDKKGIVNRWPNRKYMQLRMTLLHDAGTKRVRELMIYNNRTKKSEYYAVGDEFDGGELVFVHPRGGIVRRRDGYSLYPIGTWLDQEIDTGGPNAGDCPELKEAADRLREAAGAKSEAGRETATATPTGKPAKTSDSILSAAKSEEGSDPERARIKRTRPGAPFIKPTPFRRKSERAAKTQRDGAGAATRNKSESDDANRQSEPQVEKKRKKRRVRKAPRRP